MAGEKPTYEDLESQNRLLSRQLKEQKRINAKLQGELFTDELTGLNNNRYFKERAEIEYQRAVRSRTHLAIASLDIGNLGEINNASMSRHEGDSMLKAAAGIMTRYTRITDEKARATGGIKAARAGARADEFMIILPDTDYKSVLIFLPRMAGIFDSELPFALSEKYRRLYAGVAMGAAVYDPGFDNYNDAKTLIKASEQAMYVAKAKRKRLGNERSVWIIGKPV